MRKLRFAQAGVAFVHARHYRQTLLQMPDEVEIVGFYDPDPEAVRGSLQPEVQHVPFYGSIAELIDKARPDAMLASTFYNELPNWLLQIAEAGVHLWAEKQVAAHSDQLLPVKVAIDRNRLHFSCGLSWRFNPVVRHLRDVFRAGLLGRPYSVELSHITTSVWRRGPTSWAFKRAINGGGILNWHGCHWFDMLRFIVGSEITQVVAIEANVGGQQIDVEDAATVSFQWANGMVGSMHAGFFTPTSEPDAYSNYLGIQGADGWAKWCMGESQYQIKSTHPDWETAPLRRFEAPSAQMPGYGAEGLAMMKAFASAIRGEGQTDYTIDDVIAVLRVIEAAHASAQTGCIVHLSN